MIQPRRAPDAAQSTQPAQPLESEQPTAATEARRRVAQEQMLRTLGAELQIDLTPRRLQHPSGAAVDVTGASDDLSVLVECWALDGAPLGAQKVKLVCDAVKLRWIAETMTPAPEQLIVCVSNQAALESLRGVAWQQEAMAELGVSVRVVEIPEIPVPHDH